MPSSMIRTTPIRVTATGPRGGQLLVRARRADAAPADSREAVR